MNQENPASVSSQLLTPPLQQRHEQAGAKFAEFSGWSMPLEYSGVLAEHAAVRTHVGVFDVSHLGKVRVAGPGAVDFLNGILTNDLRKIRPGKAQYQMLCNPDGGVVDDLIAYVNSDDDVLLIPNAANTTTVVEILRHLAPAGIQLVIQHRDLAILAVQGPDCDKVLAAMGLPTELEYMSFAELARDGAPMTVCRTGYTGEKGFELVCPNDVAVGLWDEILAAGKQFGITPCGLGARDTLRTEMGYSLHGNEISPAINPVAAGLSWAIGWGKETFIGKDALTQIKADGPKRRSRGLRPLGRGIPRHAMSVVDPDDATKVIGEVTSGTFSPTLKHGIGLALVDASLPLGAQVGVLVRTRVELFELVKPPFVQPEVRS